MCEPLCGECAVRRSILSPGTAKLRRVLRTKQPKRSRGSGLPFASPLRRAQQKQGTATTRGKEFLSRVCGQKWVPPKAWRFCDTLRGLSGLLFLVCAAAARGGYCIFRDPVAQARIDKTGCRYYNCDKWKGKKGRAQGACPPPSRLAAVALNRWTVQAKAAAQDGTSSIGRSSRRPALEIVT